MSATGLDLSTTAKSLENWITEEEMRHNIVIYHEDLFSYSESFIPTQAESIREFTPYYVGTRVVDGIRPPPERTIVLNHHTPLGRAEELLYKATGFSPRFLVRLRALNPLLIHAHFGTNGAMVLPLAQQLRLPLVVTFHGRDATVHDAHLRAGRSLRERRFVKRRPQLIRGGTLFIAVSEHIRRQLLSKGFPPEKVVTHYNGIDPTLFTPPEAAAGEPTVLFVGRMVEKKGAAYLLRAMCEVQRVVPGARLLLIGDGPLRASLETLARDLRVNCEFLGRQPAEVVREHMRRAQVFCAPSVTASDGDTEGLPTVILEALAMGLPTVATDSAGNPEAVRHGENGFLVPERDEISLARSLIQLLRDEDLRRRFAWSGRRTVLTRFDARRQARALEALYTEVLPPAAGRSPGVRLA